VKYLAPATLPKAFHKNPVVRFLGVDQTCGANFGILPRFFKKIIGEWKRGPQCYYQDGNHTGYNPAL